MEKIKDDYRDAIALRLNENSLYLTLQEKCSTDVSGKDVIAIVINAVEYACSRAKLIMIYMPEYTLHDEEHLFRVFKLMERLIPKKFVESLSVPELQLLVLSCFFHDLGMAPSMKEYEEWSSYFDKSSLPIIICSENLEDFVRYCDSNPDDYKRVIELAEKGKNSEAQKFKSYLISDYIRKTHANRASSILAEDWNGKIKYRDVDLTTNLAQICFSHNEEAISVLNLNKAFLCGPDTYLCEPFVAIILRLADVLDFDSKRTPSILFSHLNVKHPVSIKEWNKHRSIRAWDIKPGYISFQARCSHPAIEASIHSFCDLIDKELQTCSNILRLLKDDYSSTSRDFQLVNLPLTVDRSRIEAEKDVFGNPKYIYRNTHFTLSKAQVVDLLMGTRLYGKTEVALRELVQNSIDTCLLRDALEKSWGTSYMPSITINFKKKNEEIILEIEDNGVGMDQDIIDNYYSKIGSSFYKSAEFLNIKSTSKAVFTPTSRFGIGILSCFMIADEINVETKRIYEAHESGQPLEIIVQGYESIFYIKKGKRKLPGTLTRLYLRKDNPWIGREPIQIISSILETFPNPPFDINLNVFGLIDKIEPEQYNKTTFDTDFFGDSWREHENLKKVTFVFKDDAKGISGKAQIGLLEKGGIPVKEIDISSREVNVDGDDYDLTMSIRMNENEIEDVSDTLGINSEGLVDKSASYGKIATSSCKISLHGIAIPMNLFPDWFSKRYQKVTLSFPFPIQLVVDAYGCRDLDLNSARTEIIFGDKWLDFVDSLTVLLLQGLKDKLGQAYWIYLKELLIKASTQASLVDGIKKVR